MKNDVAKGEANSDGVAWLLHFHLSRGTSLWGELGTAGQGINEEQFSS